MGENKQKEAGAESLFADWMKSATDFWGDMTKMQTDWLEPFVSQAAPPQNQRSKVKKTWESSSKISQAILSSFTNPENLESALKSLDSVPDLISGMAQQTWESYAELQKQWMERASKIGQQTKAYNFEDIDQDTFKTIREIYENEFQKFLNIPPLGLTRFHQEKINRVIDKFNLFQTSLSEFLYLFYVPIEKTAGVMQEKIDQMAEEGEIYSDFKQYYNIWIKILEGHYMTLLQSPEYTKVMDNTIETLVQYREAKNDMLCDVLQKLPIPTNRDMDALYKDIYLLKKKVRELSKKVDSDR